MPSREQWANWKDHPCTQAMLEIMREDREAGMEEVSYGANDDELVRLGIKIGKVNNLTGIINLTFIPQEDTNDRQS